MAYSTTMSPKDQPDHQHHHQHEQRKQQPARQCLSRHRSMVSFSTIEIREYNRVLDSDCIDVRHALTIGWEFEQCPPISLQDMACHPLSSDDQKSSSSCSSLSETSSEPGSASSSLASSSGTGYAIPKCKEERKRILCEFGYSKKELAQAEKDRIRRLKGKPPKHLVQEVQDDLAVPTTSSFMKLPFLRLSIKPLHRV